MSVKELHARSKGRVLPMSVRESVFRSCYAVPEFLQEDTDGGKKTPADTGRFG